MNNTNLALSTDKRRNPAYPLKPLPKGSKLNSSGCKIPKSVLLTVEKYKQNQGHKAIDDQLIWSVAIIAWIRDNPRAKLETRLAAARCFLPDLKEIRSTIQTLQVSITGDLSTDLGHICDLFNLTKQQIEHKSDEQKP